MRVPLQIANNRCQFSVSFGAYVIGGRAWSGFGGHLSKREHYVRNDGPSGSGSSEPTRTRRTGGLTTAEREELVRLPQGLPYRERPSLWSSAPVKGPQEDGEAISEKRVRRLMREEQIQGRVPKRFKHTTDRNHDDPIAANVLARDFTAAAPQVEGPQTRRQPRAHAGC